MTKRICSAVAMVLLLGGVAEAAKSKRTSLLVIPARQTIVQLGFNMAALRPVTLVSYESLTDLDDPAMHIWDAKTSEWVATTLGEYAIDPLVGSPRHVFVVGASEDASRLAGSAPDGSKLVTVNSMSVMNIINAMNQSLSVTTVEWDRLARWHGLKTQDMNYDRRRYGRYGRPGQTRKPAATLDLDEAPAETLEAVPAEIEEVNAIEAAVEASEPVPVSEPEPAPKPVVMAPEDK